MQCPCWTALPTGAALAAATGMRVRAERILRTATKRRMICVLSEVIEPMSSSVYGLDLSDVHRPQCREVTRRIVGCGP